MAHSLKLLLTENVENTGIVGDVVTVRKGYARNFLLPRNLATVPSDALIKQLQSKRADALKELEALRSQRASIIEKIKGFELSMVRSCNDAGILYAAVTQQDIAAALTAAGHPGITAREVRIGQNIKRIDNYDIHVKFGPELDTVIKIHIQADRKLDLGGRQEEKPAGDAKAAAAGAEGATAEAGKDGKPAAAGDKPRGDRAGGGDRAAGGGDRAGGGGDRGGERPERKDREDRGGRGSMNFAKMDFTAKRVVGWGDAPAAPAGDAAAAAADAKPAKAKGAKKADAGDKPAKKEKSAKK